MNVVARVWTIFSVVALVVAECRWWFDEGEPDGLVMLSLFFLIMAFNEQHPGWR
jgi:hypothetical protein